MQDYSRAQCGMLALGRLKDARPLVRNFNSKCEIQFLCSAISEHRGLSLAQNSFHGRTYGSMALTTSKTYYRQGFAPLMPQVVVAPYPYCLHCKVREAHPDGDSWYKVRCLPINVMALILLLLVLRPSC